MFFNHSEFCCLECARDYISMNFLTYFATVAFLNNENITYVNIFFYTSNAWVDIFCLSGTDVSRCNLDKVTLFKNKTKVRIAGPKYI